LAWFLATFHQAKGLALDLLVMKGRATKKCLQVNADQLSNGL
jgi:hypothetical protein